MGKIYKKFKEAARQYSSRPIASFKEGGEWRQYTYRQFLDIVDKTAIGFDVLGLTTGERVAILSENRWEWLASDLVLNKIGAISVPIHATANQETIEYILKDSQSSFLLVSESLLKKHQDFLAEFKDLKRIIVFGKNKSGLVKRALFFGSLMVEHQVNYNVFPETNKSALASIIYTSGTTGEPKGVMLSNDNLISNIDAIKKRIKVASSDRLLSFLPMSHVLERTAGQYVPIMSGAVIAYAESITKLADNLREIKPTILICVPKILEKTYEKILAAARNKSVREQKIFFWALKQRKGSASGRKLAEWLVFKKLRKKIFGGKLNFVVSGGAALNEYVLRFFQNIGVAVVEGYGLTETSPVITANSLKNNKLGTVGFPLAGVEVKIASDKEVLVKGPNVMSGYWHKEKMTEDTFNKDNWFKTGDLGFLSSDNFLTIIGRKKDIIISASGKNIAPEKLESFINLSPLVEHSLVVGHRKNFLGVLITPSEELKSLQHDDAAAKKAMMKEIEIINKKFEPHEQIKKIEILPRPFSVEEGELTPTLKLRRQVLEIKYDQVIKRMYK